ncbi:hypothetical protein FF011L_24750 [Roseimaritima multifibrata]|uniref:Uncharacterized protein n=1 Tax=Roseimaritima multifibrata TaxID=1930274 RepID=A0A517MFP3_9BACT|nr:hypothetical protein FF011L_24750 [Roseimaritima multifibrata]
MDKRLTFSRASVFVGIQHFALCRFIFQLQHIANDRLRNSAFGMLPKT